MTPNHRLVSVGPCLHSHGIFVDNSPPLELHTAKRCMPPHEPVDELNHELQENNEIDLLGSENADMVERNLRIGVQHTM